MKIQRDLAVALSTTTRLQEALERSLEPIVRWPGLNAGGIYLVEDTIGGLYLAKNFGLSPENLTLAIRFDREAWQSVLVMEGNPVYQGINGWFGESPRFLAVGVAPVWHDGHVIAALNVASESTVEFSDETRIMLESVAAQIGGVIARIKAERALKEREEKYRLIVENQGDMVVKVDVEGGIVFASPSFCDLFSKSEPQLLGANILDRIHPDDLTDSQRAMAEILKPPYKNQMEHRAQTAQGWRWLSWSNKAVLGEDGRVTGVICAGLDATDRKKAEEESRIQQERLIQADRMISLGVLVSGVAHEINNPNNYIMMNAPLLRKAWESVLPILDRFFEENGDFMAGGLPYSEMRTGVTDLFSGIEEGSERIRQIVLSLKDFARQDASDLNQDVDLNQVLQAAIRLLGNQLTQSTQGFKVVFHEDLPRIKGNFQRLEQVVVNLLQNACQSLSDHRQGIEASTFFDPASEEIRLVVADEGVGIPLENLKRILDPFFTTKRQSGGTGLGLSISAGIVNQHQGRMAFESRPGRGTRVIVGLPRSRDGARPSSWPSS